MPKVTTIARDALSEEDIEALADEAERGYDLSTARRVYPGRPPLGKSGASPRVQTRVDPKLAKALHASARREKRTISDLARTALAEYVGRKP
jgi:hypothetical protein